MTGPVLFLLTQFKQAFSLVNFVWHRSSESRHIFPFCKQRNRLDKTLLRLGSVRFGRI